MVDGDTINESLGGRRIRFWTPLGVDAFQLVSFKGREGLSRLFSFELQFRAAAYTNPSLDQLVGQPVVVEIELPNPEWESLVVSGAMPSLSHRRFCGILSAAGRTHEDDLYTHFRGKMVPRLWQRKLGNSYRAFHQQDTKEVVESILEGTAIRWELASELIRRNYCVQYGESDFDFISRILEEDGLFYFFEHTYEGQPDDVGEAQERLVICDSVERLQPLKPQDLIEFDEVTGGNRSSMRIRRLEVHRRLTAPSVDSIDRHFQLPSQPVLGTAGLAETVDADGVMIGLTPPAEVPGSTLYPGDFAYRFDDVSASGSPQAEDLQQIFNTSERDARIRSERLACSALNFRGESDVAGMIPGFLFRIQRGIRAGQPFYLTEIRHEARLSNSARSGSDLPRLIYRNQFRCLPKTLAYRPARKHPKKRVRGVVPALVVNDASVSEDQVCIDQYGRIKVRFPWQQAEDATPSCWIRVSQIWAGKRWGAFFWPRVGQEVLVAFEHGDPERPVVVGSVYNSENMPPLVLPHYKLSCGIHSCTHQGNPLANYSAVVFHDQPNDEFLQLHSETFECLTSETESLRHAAGRSVQSQGHNAFFDLIADTSGMGGGEEEDDDGSRTRFGYKGRTGEAIGILQDLSLLPRAGKVELVTGIKIDKAMGPAWGSSFCSKADLTFDVVAMAKKAAASKITSPDTLGTIGRFLFGPGSCGSELKVVVGDENKIVYGDSMVGTHGEELKSSFESHDSSAPNKNLDELILAASNFSKRMIMFTGFLDLACAITSKILLEKGKGKEKGNSYTSASDWIEVVMGVLMPILLSVLTKSQKTAVRLDLAKQAAERAAKDAKKFAFYAMTRTTCVAISSSVTQEVIMIKESFAMLAIEDAKDEAEAAIEVLD